MRGCHKNGNGRDASFSLCSPKKNRGINWTDKATEALLELWAEESIQTSLAANNHFSFRLFFSYFVKMQINLLVEPKMALPVSI